MRAENDDYNASRTACLQRAKNDGYNASRDADLQRTKNYSYPRDLNFKLSSHHCWLPPQLPLLPLHLTQQFASVFF